MTYGKSGRILPGIVLLLAAGFVLSACSTSTTTGGLVDANGNHPAGFVATHPSYARPDGSACTECHGDTLRGGISGVSCFTASFGGQGCHAAGPTPADHQPIATWVNAHQGAAAALRPTFSGCNAAVCHGATLQGDGGPSCFSSSYSGFLCHSGGPPPDFHPANWYADHRAFAVANGTASCSAAACHGATLHADPPDATGPSCFSATWGALACHGGGPGTGGANHAVPFFDNTHFQAKPATFTSDCSTCHAATGTSPNPAAPLCTVCHTAGSPLTALNCTSCHANPPTGGAGTYPNIAGAHAIHLALATIPGSTNIVVCNTCHNGLGTGTLNHYNRANARPGSNALRVAPGEAAFLATYNAESGATSFSATTLACGNASCHGGQTTPNWQTGTIDVVNACLSCHASGTTQFNSYNSGRHTRHTDEFGLSAATCKRCHDATRVNVAGHFDALSTPAFEQTARSTLLTALQYNGTTCNPGAGGLTGCHEQETW